jgi:hypothetical protein
MVSRQLGNQCRRGSVPKILEHGRTGLVVDGVEEAADAVGEVHRLNRWAIRRCFEERFTAERMARAYVAAYQSLRPASAPAADRLRRHGGPESSLGQARMAGHQDAIMFDKWPTGTSRHRGHVTSEVLDREHPEPRHPT